MRHFRDTADLREFAMGYTLGGLEKDLERMIKDEPEHYTDDDRQQVKNMLTDFQELMVNYDG